ncbi:hypothetical protein [Opitutus terrae]|uniref:Uncharacterized protein n=1 Tax=Opitutus terrae (strain DSM 11246 / JCM 15787 / PB90-1) TaxID=452637 RepID=B1ZQC1_OPITP|nr:hypothetical protein [Opitutus terrae]ACB73601.1 hypothetical protein Oter_0311 [Opitutus terrae PB90-1]
MATYYFRHVAIWDLFAESGGGNLYAWTAAAFLTPEFGVLEQHRARLLTISPLLLNHLNRAGGLYLRDEVEKANLRILGRFLSEGQKNGEFRDFAVKPTAATLMHAINGEFGQCAADSAISLSDYAE